MRVIGGARDRAALHGLRHQLDSIARISGEMAAGQ